MTRRRPTWRCTLCGAFGVADSADQAHDDFYTHYRRKHSDKETK